MVAAVVGRDERDARVGPRPTWTRLRARSSSSTPRMSHQPPSFGFGKRGAWTILRWPLLVGVSVTSIDASAPPTEGFCGAAASRRTAGSEATRLWSSESWRGLSRLLSQPRTVAGGAFISVGRSTTPFLRSAASTLPSTCGRSRSVDCAPGPSSRPLRHHLREVHAAERGVQPPAVGGDVDHRLQHADALVEHRARRSRSPTSAAARAKRARAAAAPSCAASRSVGGRPSTAIPPPSVHSRALVVADGELIVLRRVCEHAQEIGQLAGASSTSCSSA